MFRAGVGQQGGGPGATPAAKAGYKRPAIQQKAAVAISVPAEGGRSQHDRVSTSSSQSSQQYGNRNNGYGGNRGRGGYNNGHTTGSIWRSDQSSSQNSQHSSWKGAGREGFLPTGGGGGGADFEPGRGYRDDSFDPLADPRPNSKLSKQQQFIAQRNQEALERSQGKDSSRLQRGEDEENRRKEEENQKRRREAKEAEEEEAFRKNNATNRQNDQRKRTVSASTSASSSKQRVTDTYNQRPPVDITAANEKAAAFLEGLSDKKKVDSDDELEVVTLPVSKKEKEQLKASGKGKERARDEDERFVFDISPNNDRFTDVTIIRTPIDRSERPRRI